MTLFGMKVKEKYLGYFFVAPASLALILVIVFPATMTLLYSITPEGLDIAQRLTFGNYTAVLHDGVFWTVFRNTIVFVGASVAMHLALGLAVALMLNARVGGNLMFRVLMLLPWTVSDVVAGIVWKWILNPMNGCLNDLMLRLSLIQEPMVWLSDAQLALPGVLFSNIWRGFPFVMIILLAGLQSIPDELYEAASIDGATTAHKFRFITLPGIQKMIVVALALDTVWEFRRFGLIKAMTGGGPGHITEVLSLHVYKQYFEFFRFEYASAIAILMSIVIFAISIPYILMIVRE